MQTHLPWIGLGKIAAFLVLVVVLVFAAMGELDLKLALLLMATDASIILL